MSSYSSVARLARLMRIDVFALLARFREAGVNKVDAAEPVYDADVIALSAHYQRELGDSAVKTVPQNDSPTLLTPAAGSKVILVGNLGADPARCYMPSGEAVTHAQLQGVNRYLRYMERVIQGGLRRDTRAHLFLALLRGRVPASLPRIAQVLTRSGLRAQRVDSHRQGDLSVLAAQAKAFVAGGLLSCHRAVQEATIHPAFAPPQRAI